MNNKTLKNTVHNRWHLFALLVSFFTITGINAQTYWTDNFDNSNWRKNYDIGPGGNNFKFLSNGGYSKGGVQITVKKGSHHGGSFKWMLKENLGFEPEELYAEYRVKYDKSMNKFGGKAPGFDGTYGKAGWGNRPGKGVNGWSARGTLRTEGRSTVRNSFYVYHTNTGNNGKTWGDAVWWKKGGDMDYNKWYHVKQYIKLNTPGKSNGILKAWVNGKLVFERSNWNFRKVSDLKIYAYWFNYYNGGRDTAKKTGTLIVDDFKLYGPQGLTNGPAPKPVAEPKPKPQPQQKPTAPVASANNINFNQPKNGSNFKVNSSTNVIVELNNNNVKEVKLYVNNDYVGRQGSAPYRWINPKQLQNLKKGNYTLKAVATLKNNSKVEKTISISVGNTTPSKPSTSSNTITGTYYIKSIANGQNVISPSWDNYNVLMFNNGTFRDQQWSFEHIGNGLHKIKNVGTGRYLEVPHGDCDNRSNVSTWTNANSKHQQWIIEKNGKIVYFKPAHCTNKALDKTGKNGASVYLWSYSKSNKNQQFELVPVNGQKLISGNSNSITIYPNPVTDSEINMILTEYIGQAVSYSITNLEGKVIVNGDFDAEHGNEESITLSQISNGIYLIQLSVNNQYRIIKKLIVDN